METLKTLWIEIVEFFSTIRHAFDYRRRAEAAEANLAWIWYEEERKLEQQQVSA